MIRNLLFFSCLLAGGCLWAQSKSQDSPRPVLQERDHDKESSSTKLAPDAPIVTIKGYCSQPAGNQADHCQTVVTRAQFEKLVNALEPGVNPATRRRLASAYPQFLVMAQEAEKRGLDKGTDFAERMRFARLQILSQELVRRVQDEAAKVPAKDIADYYQKHEKDYEQASMERIVIPNRKELKAQSPDASKGDNGEEAMTKEAEALRTRAAAGEEFAKLQKEAYEFAGVSGNTEPDPKMGKLRRRGLPLAHASAFDLKPGEVSPVISDATGHYIYKLDSREAQPLEAVRTEITNVLRRERMQEMIKAIQERVTSEINESYFKEEKDDDD